jgi:hypothetical protein
LIKENFMAKKSLFFGTAALALLVLLSVVGCSNPSSGESTTYVTQPGSAYPYPDDTVFVNSWDSFIGLLNDINVETNQVRNIAYDSTSGGGGFPADVIIPTGKTVYLTDDLSAGIASNITVREGARLVLVGPFTAGVAGDGLILARGTVEVFQSLTVTDDARDVADYSVENEVEVGRNTVIGRNVTVLPGAVLTLAVDDLIPPTESQPNKFTPAQAWAAAGQGHLVIGTGGSEPGVPEDNYADELTAYNYKVSDLLVGVNPSATRTYTVTSGNYAAEELPDIPLGAFILTRAVPTTSVNETFRVNGSLTTNGTLNSISKIVVGPGGSLTLTEPANEVLTGLAELTLRPGAELDIASNDVSLASLTKLFLGDGSIINAPGDNVRFKADTPLALTIGKNVTYNVATSSAAQVNTVIAEDASLVGASTFIVYPGSTFTVNKGITFSIEDGSTFDISRIPVFGTNDPAITINGAIEVVGTGNFIAPVSVTPATITNLENLYSTIKLTKEDDITGRILLDHSSFFYFGNIAATPFVGDGVSGGTYVWGNAATTGSQIELNVDGMIIRDLNDIGTGANAALVTVSDEGAVVLKDKRLTLERGVTLAIAATEILTLVGDTDGGAELFGPGEVAAAHTRIKGGDYGWQAVGSNITIGATSGTVSALTAVDSDGAALTTGEGIFKAGGQGATITQAAVASNTLNIAAFTTISLGGTFGRKKGEIILEGHTTAANRGTISLAAATSTITTGNTAASTPVKQALAATAVTNLGATPPVIAIANVLGTGAATGAKVTTTAAVVPTNILPLGYLVVLEGNAAATPITGGITTATPTTNSHGRISAETPTIPTP